MGFTDYVERKVKFSYEGVFEVDGIYKAITKWAKNHGYKIKEDSYDVKKIKEYKQ